MDERRERGFIVLLRQVRSSALWRGLSAAQKGVTVTILLLANWRPRRARWGASWYEVQRGELSHTLESIAEEAGCTVKVVRTTLAALMADDSDLGGNGPFLAEKYPIKGTGPGTGPRILTILKYDEYQSIDDSDGTVSGTAGAQVGHGGGTAGAEREPVQPDQPHQPERETAPAVEPAPTPAAPTSSLSPQQIFIICAKSFKELRGVSYTVPDERARAADQAAAGELARTGDAEEVKARWEAALCNKGWPRIDSIADLAKFWVRFAPPPSAAAARRQQQVAEEAAAAAALERERWQQTQAGASPGGSG